MQRGNERQKIGIGGPKIWMGDVLKWKTRWKNSLEDVKRALFPRGKVHEFTNCGTTSIWNSHQNSKDIFLWNSKDEIQKLRERRWESKHNGWSWRSQTLYRFSGQAFCASAGSWQEQSSLSASQTMGRSEFSKILQLCLHMSSSNNCYESSRGPYRGWNAFSQLSEGDRFRQICRKYEKAIWESITL